MNLGLFKKKPSLSEIEEQTEQKQAENELAGTELSIAQKRAAIARLKQSGLKPQHFGMDWSKIATWLKTH